MRTERLTLVLIGASWCAPCKRTAPTAERVAEQTGVAYEYVDVETYDSRANGVTAVPTLRLYDASDTVIEEHIGAATADQIRLLVS
jgi:thiol-disulfide isomerase/thioredoxin